MGLPFSALLVAARGQFSGDVLQNPYILRVIWFSLYQAFFSTVLSVMLAVPLALALSRRGHFFGRSALLNLFSLSLIIPTVVAVFGIVAVYGRSGWLYQFGLWFDIDTRFGLYGLTGILLAHVFFNLPLSTRVFLQSLDAVPAASWRLCAQLGLQPLDVLRVIEWPALRAQLAGLAVLVFSLCFTSFAIVMTLGGGPAATTIEVAIYQALRYDFDLGLAITLALVQLGICVALMLALAFWPSSTLLQLGASVKAQRFGRERIGIKVFDAVYIALALLFILTPLLALVLSGINPALLKVLTHAATLKATLNTLVVALVSGISSVLLGCLLLSASRHLAVRLARQRASRGLELCGMAILVVPPVVLGTGLFILLRPYADVFSLALVLVVMINALMGLPFVLRVLSTPMRESARRYDRLCASLAIRGVNRLRLIEWPTLRKPLGLSLALASTLSAGDFTVIALFGSERIQTLPLLLYQRMGSYRMQDAASTALLLLLLCLILFWFIQRVVGGGRA